MRSSLKQQDSGWIQDKVFITPLSSPLDSIAWQATSAAHFAHTSGCTLGNLVRPCYNIYELVYFRHRHIVGTCYYTAVMVVHRVVYLAVWLVAGCALTGAREAKPKSNESTTAEYLELIRKDAAQLRAFMQAMPKGGELHIHFTGGIYTESLINNAVQRNLNVCMPINPSTISEPS